MGHIVNTSLKQAEAGYNAWRSEAPYFFHTEIFSPAEYVRIFFITFMEENNEDILKNYQKIHLWRIPYFLRFRGI